MVYVLKANRTTRKIPDDETALNYVVASDAAAAMG